MTAPTLTDVLRLAEHVATTPGADPDAQTLATALIALEQAARQTNAVAGSTIDGLRAEQAQDRAEVDRLRKANAELYRETTHDELTGLYNRKGITMRWAGDDVGGQDALALLDINGFKRINDTYGHAAGDAVLRHVARSLSDRWYIAGRRSGDELLIIDGRYELGQLTPDLLVWSVPLPGGLRIAVSASVGITRAVDPLPLTLARADLALYRSKRLGGTVCRWSAEVDGEPVIVDRPAVRRRDTPAGAR